ncbi:MAG: nucleotidyl transferase AbiEii/AbiGii toxin family protein, partial [Prevotella sp.]|nr:nucleotidyl transferase AbiEii/AbiGii toxin family protein [Prevotella sp.]
MTLDNNRQQLSDAIRAASEHLDIAPVYIEKDYWITKILQQLSRTSQANNTVWKGGTSLSKAYRLIDRFSSDIDVAVLAEGMKGNQIKNLISKVSKGMTEGIPETDVPGETSKGSHYRKTYHSYTSTLSGSDPRMKLLGNYVIVEINSFANPYPYVRLEIESFITQFLRETGRESLIEELDMAPFELNVLDKRRTICEKLVSLLRFSFTSQPLDGLNKKIRHFYDLHALVNDAECREYLSQSFLQDLKDLWQHDQSVFDTPDGWQGKNIDEAPLIKDFSRLWTDLSEHYVEELGQLAYRPIPTPEEIAKSLNELLQILYYFKIDIKDMKLTFDQKNMIINTLDNSKKSFAGLTLKFYDPVIRQFAFICYVKADSVYNKDTIELSIRNTLGTYFLNIDNNKLFIAKSEL